MRQAEEKIPATLVGLAVHEIIASMLVDDERTLKQILLSVTMRHHLSRDLLQQIIGYLSTIKTTTNRFKAFPNRKVEYKFGLLSDFSPCKFFDNKVFFRGVCDLVLFEPDQLTVVDFKTSPYTADTFEQYVWQMHVYSWALEKLFGQRTQAQILYVINDKQVDIPQGDNGKIEAWLNTLRTVDKVEDIPSAGKHCLYCGYQRGCDAPAKQPK